MKKVLAILCSVVCVLSMAATVYAAGRDLQSRYDVVQGIECYSEFIINGLAPGYYATSQVLGTIGLPDVNVYGYVYLESNGSKYNFYVTGTNQGYSAFAQDPLQRAVTHGRSSHQYDSRVFYVYCDSR